MYLYVQLSSMRLSYSLTFLPFFKWQYCHFRQMIVGLCPNQPEIIQIQNIFFIRMGHENKESIDIFQLKGSFCYRCFKAVQGYFQLICTRLQHKNLIISISVFKLLFYHQSLKRCLPVQVKD